MFFTSYCHLHSPSFYVLLFLFLVITFSVVRSPPTDGSWGERRRGSGVVDEVGDGLTAEIFSGL